MIKMNDIIPLIGQYLNLTDLLHFSTSCKLINQLIRNFKWVHIQLLVKNKEQLMVILKYYHFINFKIMNMDVNLYVKEFKHCHTLNLSYTNITDDSVKELKHCHTLYLIRTNITDDNVKELKSYGCIVFK